MACRSTEPAGPPSQWIKLNSDGKLGHKDTILRTFMSSSLDLDPHKSHDRLIRVQYFSHTNGRGDGWDHSVMNLRHMPESAENLFTVGGLFATLICVNQTQVSLAIVKCTFIHTSLGSVAVAPLDEISVQDSRFELSGQVLELLPSFEDDQLVWYWSTKFIEFETAKKPAANGTTHMRNMKVTVTGGLTLLARSLFEDSEKR